MAQFVVIADKLWHSGECKTYVKGEIVTLPDNTQVGDGDVIAPLKKKGKAPDAPQADTTGSDTQVGDGTDIAIA